MVFFCVFFCLFLINFYQAAIAIKINNLLICPVLEMDIFYRTFVYCIVLSYSIRLLTLMFPSVVIHGKQHNDFLSSFVLKLILMSVIVNLIKQLQSSGSLPWPFKPAESINN